MPAASVVYSILAIDRGTPDRKVFKAVIPAMQAVSTGRQPYQPRL